MVFKRIFASKAYDDSEIIHACRRDEEEVLVYLYEKNYKAAAGFILKNGGRERHISEVLHNVITHFWKDAQQLLNPKTENVHLYILNSAKSYWIRKKQLDEAMVEVDSDYDLEVPVLVKEELPVRKKLNLLSNHLRVFSDVNRKILFYTYFEEWSDEKIADILALKTVAEVRVRRNKSMQKFRNILTKNYIKRDLI